MTDTTISLKEGDIYRWHYRAPGDNGTWGRYHCCSQIGIVRKGRLYDTYWMIGTSPSGDARTFGPERLHELDLTYLGNLADLDEAKPYQADYYDDADIVDIRHANSSYGNFYLRKGAKRSAQKMLESAKQKLEKARSDGRLAALREADALQAITLIEAGNTDILI